MAASGNASSVRFWGLEEVAGRRSEPVHFSPKSEGKLPLMLLLSYLLNGVDSHRRRGPKDRLPRGISDNLEGW